MLPWGPDPYFPSLCPFGKGMHGLTVLLPGSTLESPGDTLKTPEAQTPPSKSSSICPGGAWESMDFRAPKVTLGDSRERAQGRLSALTFNTWCCLCRFSPMMPPCHELHSQGRERAQLVLCPLPSPVPDTQASVHVCSVVNKGTEVGKHPGFPLL